jgi:hypothetical protein
MLHIHKISTISVHTPVMFKPQQASQQNLQRFFTLEVQLTASKGTTTHRTASPGYLLEKGRSFVNEGGGWGLALSCRRNAIKQAQPSIYSVHCVPSVGTLFQRGLVLGVWQEELASDCLFCAFVCALMCAAQSSLVLKIQLGWNGPPLGQGPPSHDFGLPLHFCYFLFFLPTAGCLRALY